jgi:phytoene dehydrogenase-like protein
MTEEPAWDIIVIGAGLAGLTAGAYLAKAGKSVLVLEQQAWPGGCCGAGSSGGCKFPAAPHVVNDPSLVNDVLRELGAPEVIFTAVDPAFEIMGPCPGKSLVVTSDRNKFEVSARSLVPDVPAEKVDRGLGTMVDLSMEIHNETRQLPLETPELMSFFKRLFLGLSMQRKLPKTMQYGRMPVDQFLNSNFPGEEMKCLRGALRSLVPVQSARALDLLQVLGNVAAGNLYYPQGGVESVVSSIVISLTAHGGVIRTGLKVTEISVSDGMVTGVVLSDNSSIKGHTVMSAIDMKELFFNLLPEKGIPRLFREKLAKIPVSNSFFTVNLTTSLPDKVLGEKHPAILVMNPPVDEDAMFSSDDPDRVPFSVYFPCAGERNTPGGPSAVTIMAPVRFMYENNWHAGPKLEKTGDYRNFKKKYADSLVKRAETAIPGLIEHVDNMTISSPVSYHSCTGNDEGAAYGWRRPRMWRQKVPYVHGLFIAGHWTYPGPGVLKTMMSGKNASRIILTGA